MRDRATASGSRLVSGAKVSDTIRILAMAKVKAEVRDVVKPCNQGQIYVTITYTSSATTPPPHTNHGIHHNVDWYTNHHTLIMVSTITLIGIHSITH